MILEIKKIYVNYGKSIALSNVSLSMGDGTIVSIIGANGAGKSTILKAISGLIPLKSGEICFMGKKINGKSVTDIVKLGLVHVPEGRQLFPYLSVFNNLKLGASLQNDKMEIEHSFDYVYTLFPRLFERRNQNAGTLSGGEQQMLAIGRGLMAKPKLLMMDEPSLGLAPVIIEGLGKIISDINSKGVSVLLVEQRVSLAFRLASKGYVIQVGRVILEGAIGIIQSNDIVKHAYLGETKV